MRIVAMFLILLQLYLFKKSLIILNKQNNNLVEKGFCIQYERHMWAKFGKFMIGHWLISDL